MTSCRRGTARMLSSYGCRTPASTATLRKAAKTPTQQSSPAYSTHSRSHLFSLQENHNYITWLYAGRQECVYVTPSSTSCINIFRYSSCLDQHSGKKTQRTFIVFFKNLFANYYITHHTSYQFIVTFIGRVTFATQDANSHSVTQNADERIRVCYDVSATIGILNASFYTAVKRLSF